MARPELMRLLHACKADPSDATARLVLADWLEEHGDDRADLVRMEATAGYERGQPAFDGVRRSRWLSLRSAWSPLHESAWPSGGLVAIVAALPRLLEDTGRLASSEDWAWVAHLGAGMDYGEAFPRLLRSRLLDGVPSLALIGGSIGAALESLALWPGLSRLRFLSLRPADLRPQDAKPLLRSPRLAGLRGLSMPSASMTDLGRAELPELEELSLERGTEAGFAKLLHRARWSLRSLRLGNASLPVVRTVARAECCSRLRRLVLRRRIGDLSEARFWPTLEELRLPALVHEDAAALARCPEAPRLRVLAFRGAGDVSETLRRLAESPLCAALDHLSLNCEQSGRDPTEGLAGMARGPRVLELRGAGIGDEGAARLSRWPGLARCRVLDLTGNSIRPAGLAALVGSPFAGNLVELVLNGNRLGDEAGAILAGSPVATGLQSLGLTGCGLSLKGWKTLAEGDWQSLREVQADDAGQSLLRAALPSCVCWRRMEAWHDTS